MAILRLLLVLVAGCYEPVLTDCTVTCRSDADCGGDQRCAGGQCAREGFACSGDPPGIDASPATPLDAGADAPPPDTAPIPQGILRIEIVDRGKVHVPDQATCDSELADECTYVVVLGVPLVLEAEPHDNRFLEKWEEACKHQVGPTCVIAPIDTETRVTAKFKRLPGHDDDDDDD